MIGIFKKWFSKSANPQPNTATVTVAVKPTLATAKPAVTAQATSAPPATMTAAPNPAPPLPSMPSRLNNGMVELPLNEILSRLPNELAGQVLSRPGVMFSLAVSGVMEQLRKGAVRIPFGHLRQGSPPGTFLDTAGHDNSLIDLPLPLILAAIGPSSLARRNDQKQTVVPDEVTGVFGVKNSQFTARVADATPVAAPQVSRKLAAPIFPKPTIPSVLPLPTPKLPVPVAAAPMPAAVTIPAPAPVSFARAKPSSPMPFVTARSSAVPVGETGVRGGRLGEASLPKASPVVSNIETVPILIEAVSKAWPEAVRMEIEQLKLGGATISIPVYRLEQELKTGRVSVTWAELSGWLNPPAPSPAHGEVQVELPLKVVAPLFLARHRAATPRPAVDIGANVPDLFAGKNRPATPAPSPSPSTAVAPAPPSPAPRPEPKTEASPREFAQRVLSLPGVAGALLASNDGLLVAGQVPSPMKAETMAAFLPRMFTDIGRCTGEVQLGTLSAVRLSAGPALCVICQAGTLYLAVLSQPGQVLPEAALERMAGELAELKR